MGMRVAYGSVRGDGIWKAGIAVSDGREWGWEGYPLFHAQRVLLLLNLFLLLSLLEAFAAGV